MGRKTYEVALESSHGTGAYPGVHTFVFSSTLKAVSQGILTIVSQNDTEFVRELKQQPGKDICLMGGGELARPLLKAGLVVELGFNIHPVLLGSGIPLFHRMTHQIDLELLECKPFKNGCVSVRYRARNKR